MMRFGTAATGVGAVLHLARCEDRRMLGVPGERRPPSIEQLSVPVDEIVLGAPSGAVPMALLELDLARRLDRHAANKVRLSNA